VAAAWVTDGADDELEPQAVNPMAISTTIAVFTVATTGQLGEDCRSSRRGSRSTAGSLPRHPGEWGTVSSDPLSAVQESKLPVKGADLRLASRLAPPSLRCDLGRRGASRKAPPIDDPLRSGGRTPSGPAAIGRGER
jgi:hypothetical protein